MIGTYSTVPYSMYYPHTMYYPLTLYFGQSYVEGIYIYSIHPPSPAGLACTGNDDSRQETNFSHVDREKSILTF